MRALSTLALLSLAALSCRANFFERLFHHDVSVITSTIVTPEGRKYPPPSTKNPVYYVAVNIGYRDFGGIIAGDKIPPQAAMIKVITKVLAKQGFLPATQIHPPTEVIAYAWGTLYSTTIPSFNPNMPDIEMNLSQKLKFLGGDQIGLYQEGATADPGFSSLPELSMYTADQQTLFSTANDDLYVAALTAYDYGVLARTSKAVPLWKTRISCPSLGLAMDQTLPTMLAIAGPFIGRQTAKPVWTDASDKYKPDIKLGDPKLEEYIDDGAMPVFDQPAKGSGKHSK